MNLYLIYPDFKFRSSWFLFMWTVLFDSEFWAGSRLYLFFPNPRELQNRNLSSLEFTRGFKCKIKIRDKSLFHSLIRVWLLRIFTLLGVRVSFSVSISILSSNCHIFNIFGDCICDKIKCVILQDTIFYSVVIVLFGNEPRF